MILMTDPFWVNLEDLLEQRLPIHVLPSVGHSGYSLPSVVNG